MSTPHVVCSTPPIYGTPFIADVTALLLYAPSLRCVLRQYMSASTHTMQCDAPKPIPKQTSRHVARERQTNVAPTLRWWTWKQGGPKLLPVRTNRCTGRDKHACYQTHSSFPKSFHDSQRDTDVSTHLRSHARASVHVHASSVCFFLLQHQGFRRSVLLRTIARRRTCTCCAGVSGLFDAMATRASCSRHGWTHASRRTRTSRGREGRWIVRGRFAHGRAGRSTWLVYQFLAYNRCHGTRSNGTSPTKSGRCADTEASDRMRSTGALQGPRPSSTRASHATRRHRSHAKGLRDVRAAWSGRTKTWLTDA